MKRSRYTEDQIVGILKEAEAGLSVADLCRKYGMSRCYVLQLEGQVRRHDCQRPQKAQTVRERESQAKADGGRAGLGHTSTEGGRLKKLLKARARRAAAEHIISRFGLSVRRASRIVGLGRNTLRYRPRPDKDEGLRGRMKELAEQSRRFGCRRLHVLLHREGLVVNHKRTERIYREEHLSLRVRRRKKMASHGRVEIQESQKPNELWAMDYMQDTLFNGRIVRILAIIDTFTRECLRIEVDSSIRGQRVVVALSQIASMRGLPENMFLDNGPEFISKVMDAWAYERDVKLHFIRIGKPVDNTYREFQRQVQGRMLESELVHVPWACQADNRGLENGLQHGAASQFA